MGVGRIAWPLMGRESGVETGLDEILFLKVVR